MGFVLTLKQPLHTLLDLEPLSACTQSGKNETAGVRLRYGRACVRADELFALSETTDDTLTLCGDLRFAINAGAGMQQGTMIVQSSVGAGAGARMEGGELTICGDAGKNACAELQDGFVRICGNVDDGFAREVRRGMLVVEGMAHGEVCRGFRGGTAILIGGAENANLLARGMHRGTVLLPNGATAPDGFSRAADVDLVFLQLLFRQLRAHGVALPEGWSGGMFTRWVGDAAGLGKGELFVPAEVRP